MKIDSNELKKEMTQNLATINKLSERNDKIQTVLNLITDLAPSPVTSTVKKLPYKKPKTRTGTMVNSTADRIMTILSVGKSMPVREIAKKVYKTSDPSQKQVLYSANICSYLFKKQLVSRPKKGVYRVRRTKVGNGKASEVSI